jgi:hypothetical protein
MGVLLSLVQRAQLANQGNDSFSGFSFLFATGARRIEQTGRNGAPHGSTMVGHGHQGHNAPTTGDQQEQAAQARLHGI